MYYLVYAPSGALRVCLNYGYWNQDRQNDIWSVGWRISMIRTNQAVLPLLSWVSLRQIDDDALQEDRCNTSAAARYLGTHLGRRLLNFPNAITCFLPPALLLLSLVGLCRADAKPALKLIRKENDFHRVFKSDPHPCPTSVRLSPGDEIEKRVDCVPVKGIEERF